MTRMKRETHRHDTQSKHTQQVQPEDSVTLDRTSKLGSENTGAFWAVFTGLHSLNDEAY